MRVLTAIILSLCALPLWPAAIVVNDLKMDWTDVRSRTTTESNGDLSWGKTGWTSGSSLKVDSGIPASYNANDGQFFYLLDAKHTNGTTWGSFFYTGQLNFSVDVSIDGTKFNDLSFSYDFLHSEFWNEHWTDGEWDGWLDWWSGFTQSKAYYSDRYDYKTLYMGDSNYAIKIWGFEVNGKLTNSWETTQGHTTNARLLAQVVKVVNPEPSTYLTLGLFLLTLLYISHRRTRTC